MTLSYESLFFWVPATWNRTRVTSALEPSTESTSKTRVLQLNSSSHPTSAVTPTFWVLPRISSTPAGRSHPTVIKKNILPHFERTSRIRATSSSLRSLEAFTIRRDREAYLRRISTLWIETSSSDISERARHSSRRSETPSPEDFRVAFPSMSRESIPMRRSFPFRASAKLEAELSMSPCTALSLVVSKVVEGRVPP